MTLDEKLTRLKQEIDSLDSTLNAMLAEEAGPAKQGARLQIAARFESCEAILKSIRKDIADKDKNDPIRANVLSLRDQLSKLLDRYDA